MDVENIDNTLLDEIHTHAVSITREAGRILLEHLGKSLEVQFKGEKKRDPVTIADAHSNEYLTKAIREKFPLHTVLSEEGEEQHQSDSPFIWVLDPLDGTLNFMNSLPLFAVSVGVLWNRQPVVGSIFVPVSHQATAGVYHACLLQGAYLDDEKIEMTIEPEGRPLSAVPPQLASQFHFSVRGLRESYEARSLGSIALECAYTAGGIFKCTMFGMPKIWDVAAGVMLVKEAGGIALMKGKGRRDWLPLERFEPGPDDGRKEMERLRGWSYPVILGMQDIAEKARQGFRDSRTPFSWMATRLKTRKNN